MNKPRWITPLAAIAGLWLLGAKKTESENQLRLSGPYVHDNLALFLVHGAGPYEDRPLVPLGEALAAKKVVLHETGQVSELLIENVSDEDVFVQSGDIVKGGRQDRVLSVTAVIPKKSGRIPISSFCVEQGRWSERDGEASSHFQASNTQLSSKELKLAARKEKDQGRVWENVKKTQEKISKNVGADVRSEKSATSLQLALESERLEARKRAYNKALRGLIDDKKDVIGYAFAINGTMNSAEILGSRALFKKLWPKLLDSSVNEAIGELGEPGAKRPPPPVSDVWALFQVDRSGETKKHDVGGGIELIERSAGKRVGYEARDAKGVWVHKSYY